VPGCSTAGSTTLSSGLSAPATPLTTRCLHFVLCQPPAPSTSASLFPNARVLSQVNSDLEAEAGGAELLKHYACVVSVGHDEYWSAQAQRLQRHAPCPPLNHQATTKPRAGAFEWQCRAAPGRRGCETPSRPGSRRVATPLSSAATRSRPDALRHCTARAALVLGSDGGARQVCWQVRPEDRVETSAGTEGRAFTCWKQW
jgi:hypothetical protein